MKKTQPKISKRKVAIRLDSPSIKLVVGKRQDITVHELLEQVVKDAGWVQEGKLPSDYFPQEVADGKDFLMSIVLTLWQATGTQDKQQDLLLHVNQLLVHCNDYFKKVGELQDHLIQIESGALALANGVSDAAGVSKPIQEAEQAIQYAIGVSHMMDRMKGQMTQSVVPRDLSKEFAEEQKKGDMPMKDIAEQQKAKYSHTQDNFYHWFFKEANKDAVLKHLNEFVEEKQPIGKLGVKLISGAHDENWFAIRFFCERAQLKPRLAQAAKDWLNKKLPEGSELIITVRDNCPAPRPVKDFWLQNNDESYFGN